MTPAVRDILIDTRKRIHSATAEHANIGDTNALLVMDQLLTTETLRAHSPHVSAADFAIPMGGDQHLVSHHVGPTVGGEVQGQDDLRNELAREKKLREADSHLIDGLRAEVAELKKRGS